VGGAWEEQEAKGFQGWPDVMATTAAAGASKAPSPSSSPSLASCRRREPLEQDWPLLAVKLIVLACTLTTQHPPTPPLVPEPPTQANTPPPPLLRLKRNRRGAWRFEATPATHSTTPPPLPPQAAKKKPVKVDDVFGLLSGHTRGGDEEGGSDDEEDDDGEEFLLMPATVASSDEHVCSRGKVGIGDKTGDDDGHDDDDALPSFFSSAGALPPGVTARDLVGEIEGSDEGAGGGNGSTPAGPPGLPPLTHAPPPGLSTHAPPGLSFNRAAAPATTATSERSENGSTRGGNAGMILHGVSLPPPPSASTSAAAAAAASQQLVGMAPLSSPSFSSSSLPLIVLDAPNLAMRHGGQSGEASSKRFSSAGVLLASNYFRLQGHRVVGFVPDFLLDLEKVNQRRQVLRLEAAAASKKKGGGGGSDVKATQLPDDVQLLRSLANQGILIGTPPQDYDDSYCIRYAQRHKGFVVTNDMYRDHVAKITDRRERERQRQWTKTNLISFTFIGDEFMPNPNFTFSSS